MKNKLKVGSRGSQLAMTQSKQALAFLTQQFPQLSFELVEIVTKGDRLVDQSLRAIGGQGAFVKEIERQLSSGTIDLAIHSYKDVPTQLPADLMIGGVLERRNPLDCLLFKVPGQTLLSLPSQAVVGTSSLRRQAQLLQVRPDLKIKPIRGNIDTRIRKLQTEAYDAIVLASAGMERLGIKEQQAYEELSAELCVPAIGQGALAIECRQNEVELVALLEQVSHQGTLQAVTAERAFLSQMDGSCTFPIGGYAQLVEGQLQLTGMIADQTGQRLLKETLSGNEPRQLGQAVAKKLFAQGAAELIKECQRHEAAALHKRTTNP